MLLVVYQRVCDFHVLLPGGSVHLAKKPGKRDMGEFPHLRRLSSRCWMFIAYKTRLGYPLVN